MTYDDKPETAEHRDTEITLSNTTLLFIFLGVAIICGVFFGFGYTIGKRNAAPAVALVTPPATPAKAADIPEPAPVVTTTPADSAANETPAPTPPAVTEKPSAAAMTSTSPATAAPTPAAKAAPAPTPVAKPTPPPPVMKTTPPPAPVAAKVAPPVSAPAAPAATPRPVMAATKPAPVAPKPKKPVTASAPIPTPSPAPPAVPSRTYVVQVAAVSHQTDADNLVGALRRKGIAANSYPGTQDNLIHVQVGPFSSQKDAAAMRDHLSDEGYLAIVK